MGTSFFCFPRILRRPQTETVANLTRQSNVAARHNPPEHSLTANPEQFYHLDTITSDAAQQSGSIQYLVGEGSDHNAASFPLQQLVKTPPPAPQRSLIPPPHPEQFPLPQGENKVLPGFVEKHRIFRQQQVPGDGRCVECAMNTVLHFFYGEEEIMETEEFKQQIAGKYPTAYETKKIARKKGLKIKRYRAAKLGEASIDDAKAFFISVPGSPPLFHTVAMVEYEGFHLLSDSGDQDKAKSEMYPGIARYAIFDYQRRHNVAAREVTTFHKRVPPHSPEFDAEDTYEDGCEFFDNKDWKEAIEEFDEVIMHFMHFLEAKELPQHVLFAKVLYCKGLALYKSGLREEAIENYNKVIERFGNATEPALCKVVEKARHNKKVALDKQSVHGDGEQARA